MAATSVAVTIKEEPKETGVQPGQNDDGEEKAAVTLDYNAIFGNMYRDFLAANSVSTTNGSGSSSFPMTTTTVSATASATDNGKVSIPPECYAESFDIQDVVNEFKVSLEKFGVSQRFAAKHIMEDTSQGNLSFLMDKGKRLKWAELSPKGRIPYVRMKQWLDSREKQANTIEMVKENKAITRQNASKDAFQRRERFSLFQLTVLCRLFEENPNPSMTTRQAIADKLSIPPERINVWFQNQRARGFPAKRILQQSFHAANSTNGAAKSASIMNSVAMEIVNQSKTDSLLANNSALVSQYVENSLLKTEADESDVHRLLLEYSSLGALGSSLGKHRETSPLPGKRGSKRSREGSHTSNNSGENCNTSKVKTEFDKPDRPLNDIDKEMTSNEKVNGYLSHLNENQSTSKSGYGRQLDSVVKRIAQSQSSGGIAPSHAAGSNHTQTGAAKRKPAFLNKVLAEPKGDASTFDNYTAPFGSPTTTAASVKYDSSPLSALYRQTASVNFTPPNASFNYLFDLGSPAQLPMQPNFYTRPQFQGTVHATLNEPKKRLINDVASDLAMDLKRRKTSDTFSESQQSGSIEENNQDRTDDVASDKVTQNDVSVSMKVPVKVLEDTCNIPKPEMREKEDFPEDNSANVSTEDEVHTLKTSKEDADTVQDDVSAGQQNALTKSVKVNETKDMDKEKKDRSDNSSPNSDSSKDCAGVDEVLSNQTVKISEQTGGENETPVSESSKQTNDELKTDKVSSNNSDIDKPLSKEEMDLFKSLYARFVKYHFAQMQFPDTK